MELLYDIISVQRKEEYLERDWKRGFGHNDLHPKPSRLAIELDSGKNMYHRALYVKKAGKSAYGQ